MDNLDSGNEKDVRVKPLLTSRPVNKSFKVTYLLAGRTVRIWNLRGSWAIGGSAMEVPHMNQAKQCVFFFS
jgi:hypothetical protein